MQFNITIIVFFIFCALFNNIHAQENKTFKEFNLHRQEKFNKYNEQKQKDFEEFRRKRNEEFAKYIRKEWRQIESSPVIPKPKEEIIPPLVIPKDEIHPVIPSPKPLPFKEVIPAPKPEPRPEPIEPIENVPVPNLESTRSFTFFGTDEKIRFDKINAIHLSEISEYAIADAWVKLSAPTYTNILYDCLRIRDEYKLCDWAYLMMLKKMSEAVFGKGTNEATLLTAYIYCQSGYKMRMLIINNKLEMAFASKHTIYNWNYYSLDGDFYYPLNNTSGNVRICEQDYPNEKSMSLLINKEQKFALRPTALTSHQSTRNPEINISMVANQNMLDFYSSYPTSMIGENFVTRWAMYANMPMPQNIKEQVYPQIKKSIEGVDKLTAVNRILNWVQTGFEYEYDDKVWGNDRAFFPEESLFYPYCDCEDRSILLTRIVRDILGLRCMLVFYPGHLAAAIEIPDEKIVGDYIEYKGTHFFIADGTIIGYGAPVGQTMRGMNNQTAKIILLE